MIFMPTVISTISQKALELPSGDGEVERRLEITKESSIAVQSPIPPII